MAGTYPDAPGPRVPYDRDGTTIIEMASGPTSPNTIANSNLVSMNDEGSNAYNLPQGYYFALMFPVLMDITHYAFWVQVVAMTGAAVSTNTTNGVDGTWTAVTLAPNCSQKEDLRATAKIQAITANGIKAIRFAGGGFLGSGSSISSLHIYGKPSATSDRLEMWHPTLDQPLSQTPAWFDYGDVSRGSGALTKDFRIKNLSTTLTANSITVGVEALTDNASPTYVSQTQFRYNGGSYGSTASLGSLAPSTISQIFTVQLTTTASSGLSTWWQRYYATASSWS